MEANSLKKDYKPGEPAAWIMGQSGPGMSHMAAAKVPLGCEIRNSGARTAAHVHDEWLWSEV